MFDTVTASPNVMGIQPGSQDSSEGQMPAQFNNYAQYFQGIPDLVSASPLGNGEWQLVRAGDQNGDYRATATIGPDGKVNVGQFSYRPAESLGKTLGGAASLFAAGFGGLGALGVGPAAGLFGGAGGAAGSAAPAGNGAFLGEGVASGVGGWDAAAGLGGAGGAAGAAGATGAAGGSGLLGQAASALGVSPTTLVNGAGNLASTLGGLWATNKAADAQVDASNRANELAKYMYDTTRADNLPALQARNSGLEGYQKLLSDPYSVTQTPGYQFRFQQGQNAYDNSGAARGMRLSGAQAKALTQYGQDFATKEFDNALGRYGNLTQLGATGTQTIANAGQNYSQQGQNNITNAGTAQSAGYIGGANALTGGVNNFLKGWNEDNLLRRYYGG